MNSPRLATKILLIIFISQLNGIHIFMLSTLRTWVHPMKTQYFYDLGLNNDAFFPNPRGKKALIHWMAGLLTDSTSYRTFPTFLFPSVVCNWFIDKMLYRASQQRDCPGFTPDSLLIFVRWPRIPNQFGDKYREILDRVDTFCTKSSILCNDQRRFVSK